MFDTPSRLSIKVKARPPSPSAAELFWLRQWRADTHRLQRGLVDAAPEFDSLRVAGRMPAVVRLRPRACHSIPAHEHWLLYASS